MARRSSQARAHAQQAQSGRTVTRHDKRGKAEVVRRPMGRPTALTDRVEETILTNLMDGLSIDASCALAGVTATTFYRWMQRGEDARDTLDATGTLDEKEERFRDFREAVLDARALAEQKMVSIVFRAAQGGQVTSEKPLLDLDGQPVRDDEGNILYERTYTTPDGRLALQYLQRARPKDWSLQGANLSVKHEVSGPGGGPIEVEHSTQQVMDLTAQLAAVRALHEQEAEEDAILDGEVVDDSDDEV